MNKGKKKLTAALLVVSLLATSMLTACSQKSDDEVTLGDTNYEDMVYEHYDPTDIQAMIDDCTDLYADKKNAKAMLEEFDQIWDEMEIVSQNYVLAELHNYADVTDEYYEEEFSYIDELYTDLYDQCCTLGHDILNSPCEKAARKNWDEEDIEVFEDYEEMTDEQKALDKQESDLEIEYNEAASQTFTTTINGQEYSADELPDLYYDGTISYDEYWIYYTEIMKNENEVLGAIYVEMVKVRQQIAESYGYDNYADYAYTEIYDRDYTPEEAAELSEVVKEELVEPVDNLGNLCYDGDSYDTADEISNNLTEEEWMDMVQSNLSNVDPDMEETFQFMVDHNLYDLEYRDTKYDGGFTQLISGYYEPYLFITPGSGFYDVMTLVHEFGHYNAYYVNIAEGDSVSNLDLAEIHSQGLEVLYIPYYGDMLGDESLSDFCEEYCLYQNFASVTEGCMYDEFQQQVYALEDPTLDQINEIFGEIAEDYGYQYGEMNQYLWCEVPHNFDSPMYYISYAVSALPALEIWETSTTDYDKAVKTYLKVVDAGEAGGYLDTLKACGLDSPFEDGYIDNLVDTLNENFF